MKQLTGVVCIAIFSSVASIAMAGDFYVYPAKKQSQQQQNKDTQECQQWAKQQTGFDPTAAPTNVAPAQNQQPHRGGALRGAAAGAVLGEVINDDASKGAAVGATLGAVRNSRNRRNAAAEQQAAQAQSETQYKQQRTSYNNAYSACLKGRDYSLSPK